MGQLITLNCFKATKSESKRCDQFEEFEKVMEVNLMAIPLLLDAFGVLMPVPHFWQAWIVIERWWCGRVG